MSPVRRWLRRWRLRRQPPVPPAPRWHPIAPGIAWRPLSAEELAEPPRLEPEAPRRDRAWLDTQQRGASWLG